MSDWLANLFGRVSVKGAHSRRLSAVVVGVVLLVWLGAASGLALVPEIPGSVLVFVAIVVGTSALQSTPPNPPTP